MFFEDRDLEDKSIELSTETEAIPNHFVGNHNMIVDPELEQSQKTPSAMSSGRRFKTSNALSSPRFYGNLIVSRLTMSSGPATVRPASICSCLPIAVPSVSSFKMLNDDQFKGVLPIGDLREKTCSPVVAAADHDIIIARR
jgi:hypothetical protein